MGRLNAEKLFGMWAGDLPRDALAVLFFMALKSNDKDDPPYYAYPRWTLAAAISKSPEEAESDALQQRLKRAIRQLVQAKAILPVIRPGRGRTSMFELQLGGQKVTPKPDQLGGQKVTPKLDSLGVRNRPPNEPLRGSKSDPLSRAVPPSLKTKGFKTTEEPPLSTTGSAARGEKIHKGRKNFRNENLLAPLAPTTHPAVARAWRKAQSAHVDPLDDSETNMLDVRTSTAADVNDEEST